MLTALQNLSSRVMDFVVMALQSLVRVDMFNATFMPETIYNMTSQLIPVLVPTSSVLESGNTLDEDLMELGMDPALARAFIGGFININRVRKDMS